MENIKVATYQGTQGSPAGFECLLTMYVMSSLRDPETELSFLCHRWGLIYKFLTLADLIWSAHQHILKLKIIWNPFTFSLSGLHHTCVLYSFMTKQASSKWIPPLFLVTSPCLGPINAEVSNLEAIQMNHHYLVSYSSSPKTKRWFIWGYTLGWYWNHNRLWDL